LACELAPRISIGGKPTMLEPDVAAIHPPELLKPLVQRRDPRGRFRIVLGVRHQHADAPHPLAVLRPCRERPRPCTGRRAAEQRDDFAPCQFRAAKKASENRAQNSTESRIGHGAVLCLSGAENRRQRHIPPRLLVRAAVRRRTRAWCRYMTGSPSSAIL